MKEVSSERLRASGQLSQLNNGTSNNLKGMVAWQLSKNPKVEKRLYQRDVLVGFLANGAYFNKNDREPTEFWCFFWGGGAVIEI